MTATRTEIVTDARLQQAIFTDVLDSLLDVIRTHRVTWGEYRAATEWLTEAGIQGYEIPLLLDVFLSPTVDDVNFAPQRGTESNVEDRSTSRTLSRWSLPASCLAVTTRRVSDCCSRRRSLDGRLAPGRRRDRPP